MENEVVSSPHYVSVDPKKREEYLSQLGNFTPGEREIFHFLCEHWQPELPFARVSAGANLGVGNRRGEFLNLMKKLRKGRIGVLRTSVDGGARREEAVILTNEGDLRFYSYLIDEESDRIKEEVPGMPALEKLLAARSVEVPDRHIRDYSYDELIAATEGRIGHPRAILRLPAIADQSVLISPHSARTLATDTAEAMRLLLSDGTTLGEVAKVCATSVGKLKAVLGSDHASAWVGLTKCLFDNRKELEANPQLSLPKALYATAAVAHRVSVARASADRERVKREKERLQDLGVIAAEVRKHSGKILSQIELNRILDGYEPKYGTEFEQFRDEFYKRFVTPKQRRNLSTIQFLGRSYIHRDNLYRVFLDRYQDAQAELYTHYLTLMGDFVRSRHSAASEVFASHDRFCEDIREHLPQVDKILAELFQKPFLLAEVIVYGEKNRRNVSSIDDVRTILARFFVSERMDLRDFATIFELSMVELFETAFVQLPLLLQIWLRISGRYEGLRETVLRRGGSRGLTFRAPKSSTVDREPARGPESKAEPVRHNGTSARRPATAAARRRAGGGGRPNKVHYYTKKDQEQAWDQFSQALKQ